MKNKQLNNFLKIIIQRINGFKFFIVGEGIEKKEVDLHLKLQRATIKNICSLKKRIVNAILFFYVKQSRITDSYE